MSSADKQAYHNAISKTMKELTPSQQIVLNELIKSEVKSGGSIPSESISTEIARVAAKGANKIAKNVIAKVSSLAPRRVELVTPDVEQYVKNVAKAMKAVAEVSESIARDAAAVSRNAEKALHSSGAHTLPTAYLFAKAAKLTEHVTANAANTAKLNAAKAAATAASVTSNADDYRIVIQKLGKNLLEMKPEAWVLVSGAILASVGAVYGTSVYLKRKFAMKKMTRKLTVKATKKRTAKRTLRVSG